MTAPLKPPRRVAEPAPMPRRLAPALVAALLGTLVLLAAAPLAQAAARKPCVPGEKGPRCHWWSAKVTFVSDGDTLRADVAGDGTGRERNIRLTGINTMELTRYSKYASRRRGACHGLEATAFVARYVKASGRRILLSAQKRSSRTGKRLRRSVWVRSGGRWQDLGKLLVQSGHALWLPNPVEWAHNEEYHRLAQDAANRRLNLYDPDYCGAGPSPEAALDVSIKWDADGNDDRNVNGEWIDIRNTGPAPVPLGGWWVRDSYLITNGRGVPGFEFPAYAVVLPGSSVRVHVGRGENTPDRPGRFFWGQRTTVFENVNPRRASGDGAYQFDPQGDLRASRIYPCTVACESPLSGAIKVRVNPTTPESITVTNVSGAPVDLAGHLIKLHLNGRPDQFIFGYDFDPGSVLAPGDTLQLVMDGSPRDDEPLLRHLGRGPFVLADGGNVVSLRSADDVVVDCADWGRARCR